MDFSRWIPPLLAIVAFSVAGSVEAQEPLILSREQPRVALISSLGLAANVASLEGPDEESLAEVRVPPLSERFVEASNLSPQLTPGVGVWLRFRILREGTQPWVVAMRHGTFRRACVHWPRALEALPGEPAGETLRYASHCTGTTMPFSTRAIRHPGFVFPLPGDLANGRPVYFYAEGLDTDTLTVELVARDTFHRQDHDAQLAYGLYYGALAAMVSYNLFLFASVRERDYLLYALHIGSLGLAFFGIEGLGAEYLWPNLPQLWPLPQALLGVAFCSGAFYVRSFLHTREHAPRLDVALRLAALAGGLGALLSFFAFGPGNVLVAVAALLFASLSFLTAIVRLRDGYRPARFLLAAEAAFLASLPFAALSALNVLPWLPSQRSVLEVSVVLGALLLSFGLADRMRQLAAERGRLIPRLEARNAEMERFNYTVSHDLKTPLVTIQGFLGWVEHDALTGQTERLQGDIKRIRDAVDQMRQLLDDLFEFSRRGNLVMTVEHVDLNQVVGEVCERFAARIAERHATVEIAEDLGEIDGDRTRLKEVFCVVLDNALRFSRGEEAPHVEIRARRDGNATLCWVRDHGIGIAPLYHEKIFGLFEQLEPEAEGTGVGLALAQRIVEAHGGRIWVESPGLGDGSTFYWTLPDRQPA